MAEGRVTRKLAAILAADVVGFSRLMSADEVGALALVTAHLEEVVRPAVEAHRGRIFKTMGDGFLVEFASAVEAVECAVRIQRAIAKRTGDTPEERRAIFRIGINLGDIIIQDDDVFGDGVNVAARIEALTDPGSVFISRSVHDQIGGKCDFPLEDMGEHEVKNIPRPVHVFRVVTDPSTAPVKRTAPAPGRQMNRWLAGVAALVLVAALCTVAVRWFSVPEEGVKVETVAASAEMPSIAVLPLINLSDDPEQEYFADGISEDLITDLSKVPGLMVISRTSSFAYKGKSADIRDIARDLNTRYVVEGSVRRANSKIRINLQLIDAKTGHHVWAERYDNTMEEVFVMQDSITRRLVEALDAQLESTILAVVSKRKAIDLNAYEVFLQGQEHYFRYSKENNQEARRLYLKATELDPTFGRAYAMRGLTYLLDFMNGWTDTPDSSLEQGRALAEKAISLDASLPVAYFVTGLFYREKREYVKALVEAQKAIDIDPSYADGHVLLATLLYYAGRPKEGLEVMQRAIRLHPHHAHNYSYHLGQAYFILGRYDEAINTFKQGIELLPTSERLHLWLAATYAQAGMIDEAQWQANEVIELNPDFSLQRMVQAYPFKYAGDLANVIDALRKAGLPE